MSIPLGLSASEVAAAIQALSNNGMTAVEATRRLQIAMRRLESLDAINERVATKCPATELLNMSENGNPKSPKLNLPKNRMIRKD